VECFGGPVYPARFFVSGFAVDGFLNFKKIFPASGNLGWGRLQENRGLIFRVEKYH